jgi:hypothetical protein
LSWIVIRGNRGPSNGAAVLLGDEEAEFESIFTTITKWSDRSNMSEGTKRSLASSWVAEYDVKTKIALFFFAFKAP